MYINFVLCPYLFLHYTIIGINFKFLNLLLIIKLDVLANNNCHNYIIAIILYDKIRIKKSIPDNIIIFQSGLGADKVHTSCQSPGYECCHTFDKHLEMTCKSYRTINMAIRM